MAKTKYETIASKLGTADWKEDEDGPALENEKRAWDQAQTLVDRLSDKLEVEARSANGGGSSDGEKAPGVTVNILSEGRLGDKEGKARGEFRMLKAIDGIVNRNNKLDGLEAEMHTEGVKELRALGKEPEGMVTIPSFIIGSGKSSIFEKEQEARYMDRVAQHGGRLERRDVTAETDASGGYMVQTSVGRLIPVLEPRLVLEALGATKLVGLRGDLDLPRMSAYGSATWEGEIDDAAETQPTFDKVSLNPERLSAYTQVSRQSIIQAQNVDVENMVRRGLNRAVKRGLDTAGINGSGSGDQPTGILNTSSINSITIGTDGGPLDWALTVQFETETATDNADMGRLAYLTTPGVAGMLKTLKRDVAGNNFIWEGNNQGGGLVNGYRALTSTLVPSNLTKGAGTSLHAMIFANWEELIIAQWGGVDLIIDPYTQKNKAMIEITINSWWDIALMHLASFCECNEIDIS